MSVTAMRILAVGKSSQHTAAVLARLRRKSFGSHVVETLHEARELLATFQFDVVLAPEYLPDGRGYELTDPVVRRSNTLLIAISLSESCLWLPAVERGVRVLGERALPADFLEQELEAVLAERARENSRPVRRRTSVVSDRRLLKQAMPQRLKNASVSADKD
jgi:DNA-binding NtrC family response regulator